MANSSNAAAALMKAIGGTGLAPSTSTQPPSLSSLLSRPVNSTGAAAGFKNPRVILKWSMVIFLLVQAVRQLLQENQLAGEKTARESRNGQVASWFVSALIAMVALILASGPALSLDTKWITSAFVAMTIGVLGSGVALTIAATQDKKTNPEPSRLWFGIAHIIFGVFLLLAMIYSLIKQ